MTSLSVIPEIFSRESKDFKYCGPLIEPFRGDEKGAIEAFRNDDTEVFFLRVIFDLFLLSFLFFCFSLLGVIRGQSPLIVLLRHSRNFLSGIHVFAFFFGFLSTVDPGLKIAGVTDKEGRRRSPFLLPLLAKTKKEGSYPP